MNTDPVDLIAYAKLGHNWLRGLNFNGVKVCWLIVICTQHGPCSIAATTKLHVKMSLKWPFFWLSLGAVHHIRRPLIAVHFQYVFSWLHILNIVLCLCIPASPLLIQWVIPKINLKIAAWSSVIKCLSDLNFCRLLFHKKKLKCQLITPYMNSQWKTFICQKIVNVGVQPKVGIIFHLSLGRYLFCHQYYSCVSISFFLPLWGDGWLNPKHFWIVRAVSWTYIVLINIIISLVEVQMLTNNWIN